MAPRVALVLLILLAVGLPTVARAAPAAGPAPAVPANTEPAPPPPPPRAFLMTIGPGAVVYERFGHNALVILDPASGIEAAYNWGVFDFEQPHFIARFLMGRMLYQLQSVDIDGSIEMYRQAGRSVRVTELLLTQQQARRLADFAAANDTDARRFYRYHYFLDNCSTRVRDALDYALEGALARGLRGLPPDPASTYRFHAERLVASVPWAAVGLAYALGLPADQPLGRWEEGFIPMLLEANLRRLAEADHPEPLVLLGRDVLVFPSDAFPEPAAPLRWWPAALGVSLPLAGLIAWLLSRSRRAARVLGAVLAAGFSLLAGLAGLLLSLLIVVTDHTFTHWNLGLLHLGPWSLATAVSCLLLVRVRPPGWVVYPPAVALAASLLALPLAALPGTSVVNPGLVLGALPLHLGILLGTMLALRASRRLPAAMPDARPGPEPRAEPGSPAA